IAAIAVGAAFVLGWRTRIVSVLFAFVVVALENRAPLLTDGGDNVLTLMSIYLVFTECGTYWSLDARRRGLRASAEARAALLASDSAAQSREPEVDPAGEYVPGWRAELAEAWRRMAI